MIVLHTWKTPNGRKPAIMLEEVGLDYRIEPVDLSKNAQFDPAFLAIAPNNKIPAIVDEDADGGPQAVFESGAILTYLGEKTGQLLPRSGPGRWAALEWLHWQIGGIGPMFGQLSFFALRSEEKSPLAIGRFKDEADRLISVMEKRLAAVPFLGGEYSIADIATYPWVSAAAQMMTSVLGETFEGAPATRDWIARVGDRSAVQRGMAILDS